MAEEQKPETAIILTLKDQAQEEVKVKVKTVAPLQKIFQAYCTKTNRQIDQLRFVFDGQTLLREKTPADYDMEDGDQIDVFLEQVGGQ